MKLCKDCKYYKSNLFTFFSSFAECHHPNKQKINPVNGKVILLNKYCSVHRGLPFVNNGNWCDDGNWFEQK